MQNTKYTLQVQILSKHQPITIAVICLCLCKLRSGLSSFTLYKLDFLSASMKYTDQSFNTVLNNILFRQQEGFRDSAR